MGKPSVGKLEERALDLGLLNERQLQEVRASFGSSDIRQDEFLQFLVRREFLTNYQVERLTKGERTGFFFGDYMVLYLVGSGTFARVYRAVHRESGKVVALKVLRRRFSDKDKSLQCIQFVREGRIGCSLRHANIVPIYEVYSQDKTHFLVMEFVEGRNLREFVKIRKRLDPAEATRLMIDICEGMRYAFECGLTHRDLKMSNVLVSSRGQAKLVDFGLAAVDETLTDDDLAKLPNTRTIDYAALERATGVRKDDTRSDIYFLGCIYYNMLTGEPPLKESRDRIQRLSKQRFLEVVPIRKADPGIPDSVALVVNKSMLLDPARRYQSPGNMLADLEIALRRLADEKPVEQSTPAARTPSAGKRVSSSAAPIASFGCAEERPSVMVVESNAERQNIFRDGFKRAGYRVLLTSNPDRALDRFQQEVSGLADCVVISAQELGEAALETFNRFGEDTRTNFVPVVLLLDDTQRDWQSKAHTAEHRVVLPLPITMKQLRAELAKLMAMQPRK